MPRLLGLGHASKIYRNNNDLKKSKFSNQGDEIAFGTIGNASTSEGLFFETINAAGVLQVPVLISIWDDGWGISVPTKYQTTKGDISEILKGFQRTQKKDGLDIYKVNGWDYSALCSTYALHAACVQFDCCSLKVEQSPKRRWLQQTEVHFCQQNVIGVSECERLNAARPSVERL